MKLCSTLPVIEYGSSQSKFGKRNSNSVISMTPYSSATVALTLILPVPASYGRLSRVTIVMEAALALLLNYWPVIDIKYLLPIS